MEALPSPNPPKKNMSTMVRVRFLERMIPKYIANWPAIVIK